MLAAISVTSWPTVGRRATCGIIVTFGCSPERAVRRQRLGLQRVERGIGELPGIERRDQVLVDDVPAAADVYQHRALRHHREGAGAEDALGLARQRQKADGDVGLVRGRLELVRAMEDRHLFGPRGLRTQADTGKPSDFSTSAGAFAIMP